MRPTSCGGSLRVRRWWAIGVGLLGGLGPPGPLGAQQGEARGAVERLQAEVEGEESQRRLEARARELRQGDESDSARLALRLIHLGLVQLRLIDLGAGAPPPNGEFERASRLQPGWAYAWYGRGRAKRAEGDWLAGDGLNLGSRVGFGDYEEAVTYFERALALEPEFVPALRELAATIALLKDTARTRGILLPALARAQSAGDSILLQSRIAAERSLGDPGAALPSPGRPPGACETSPGAGSWPATPTRAVTTSPAPRTTTRPAWRSTARILP